MAEEKEDRRVLIFDHPRACGSVEEEESVIVRDELELE